MRLPLICILVTLGVLRLGSLAAGAEPLPDPPPMPADYYAEPAGLPFDEKILAEGKEATWHWTEFVYTSVIANGQPVRIHAYYAVPNDAGAANKVPAIIITHGKFGMMHNPQGRDDPRYWAAFSDLAKAGYAVLFYEWNPESAIKWTPSTPDEPKRFSTFGTLDYSKDYNLPGNDWKDSLWYQAIMAGRRAITWVSAHPEIDTTRIGLTGASYGGMFSSLLASIDPRITADNSVVYTSGFGPAELSYNMLPRTWTLDQVQSWRARFDSSLMLKKRSIPVLYTYSTDDAAFPITKVNFTFSEMPPTKHLILNPNQNHNAWNFPQTIHFFDEMLRGKGSRPIVSTTTLQDKDGVIRARAQSSVPKVEFFYALDPKVDPTVKPLPGFPSTRWKWLPVTAVADAVTGSYAADIKLTPEERAASQAVNVFARATSDAGVEECSPLSTVTFAAANP